MTTLVIALGDVPSDLVQPVLGENYRFVENPNPDDLLVAEGAILRADLDLDEELLSKLPNLKIACRTGVGVDRVDLERASNRGVAIAITPGANSTAVAEGTMAQLLSLAKRLPVLTQLVRDGGWSERDQIVVGDLDGKTLGLIGFGRIGSKVADFAKAFGMRVLAFDPHVALPEDLGVSSLEELLRSSDFLSVHVPLTEKTRNLVSKKEIDLLPQGAVIINCSRGGIVDLDAAALALETGKLAGIGLDSFDPEPAVHHRVFDLPNVILTPHVMGLSQGSKQALFVEAARAVRNFFENPDQVVVVNS
jgi:D-3-phosphoglycerate dehydrogenase / 2-oxoglutarate reductase